MPESRTSWIRSTWIGYCTFIVIAETEISLCSQLLGQGFQYADVEGTPGFKLKLDEKQVMVAILGDVVRNVPGAAIQPEGKRGYPRSVAHDWLIRKFLNGRAYVVIAPNGGRYTPEGKEWNNALRAGGIGNAPGSEPGDWEFEPLARSSRSVARWRN